MMTSLITHHYDGINDNRNILQELNTDNIVFLGSLKNIPIIIISFLNGGIFALLKYCIRIL